MVPNLERTVQFFVPLVPCLNYLPGAGKGERMLERDIILRVRISLPCHVSYFDVRPHTCLTLPTNITVFKTSNEQVMLTSFAIFVELESDQQTEQVVSTNHTIAALPTTPRHSKYIMS